MLAWDRVGSLGWSAHRRYHLLTCQHNPRDDLPTAQLRTHVDDVACARPFDLARI